MVKIDNELLYLLVENSRTGLRELSHYLKKTPQRLKYSVSILEKEGIIKEPFCIFDYSYFGLMLFRVYFRGAYIGERDKLRIINELSNNPYVISIYEFTGEFDLAVEFASPNPSRFNKELKRIASSIPTLNDYKIVLNLVTHLCPRNYLTKNETLHDLSTGKIVGGDRERESFDKKERAVMKSLLTNPKIRLIELAEKTGLNVKTAKSVLSGLLKRRVIKGFKYVMDTNKLGANKCTLFLKLHNLSIEKETQLMEYVLNTKEIVQVNKTVGDWDMEIDIEAFDKTRIRYVILYLREHFKEIVEKSSLIEFYNYWKRSFLPSYLFKQET